jgi:protein TonB
MAPDTFRWGVGLSIMLHSAAVLVVLAAPRPSPPAAGEIIASVELIMVPGQPQQAPAADVAGPTDESTASLEHEAVPDKVAVPEPTPVTPAIPEQTHIPEPQKQSEPVPHPAIPVPVQSHSPAHRPSPRTQTARPHDTSAPSAEASGSAPAASASEAAGRASADWLADVTAWLAAHRSYPETARRLGRQGTVVLQFTVDPAGQVMDVNLAQSSGSDVLDNAAEAMLRDAHLPPFPPQMNLPRQSLTVPIHYRLD